MRTVADFRRAAVAGSRWVCVNHLHPHVSGERLVTRAGPSVLSYTATKADGSVVTNGRMEIPRASAVRIEGDTIVWVEDGRDCYAWTRLPVEDDRP